MPMRLTPPKIEIARPRLVLRVLFARYACLETFHNAPPRADRNPAHHQRDEAHRQAQGQHPQPHHADADNHRKAVVDPVLDNARGQISDQRTDAVTAQHNADQAEGQPQIDHIYRQQQRQHPLTEG